MLQSDLIRRRHGRRHLLKRLVKQTVGCLRNQLLFDLSRYALHGDFGRHIALLDPLRHQINRLIHEHVNLLESGQPIFKVLNALQSQPIARFIQRLNPAALANWHQVRWMFCCRRAFAVGLEKELEVHPVRLGQTLKIDRFKAFEHPLSLLSPLDKGRF